MSGTVDSPLLGFLAAASPSGTVVDIGCGDGAFLQLSLGALGGWTTAFGVDPRFENLVKASERFQDDMRVSFLQASGDALPLKAGCAGLVILSKALHHLERPRETLAEARRVLKAGGSLLLFEQAADGSGADHRLWDEYHLLRGGLEARKGLFMRPLYDIASMDALLSGCGFSKRRSLVLDGEPVEGQAGLEAMDGAIRASLAAAPRPGEDEAVLGEWEGILSRMQGRRVLRPDLYASEWEKGEAG